MLCSEYVGVWRTSGTLEAWKRPDILGFFRIPRILDMLMALDGVGTFFAGFVVAICARAGAMIGKVLGCRLDCLTKARNVRCAR